MARSGAAPLPLEVVPMLALDTGPFDVPLLDETIGANLARTVAAHGDREALVSVHQSIRWSYRELAERVETLARGLLGLGLAAGDRVGLWSPNHAEWTLLQYATAEIGVILVNVNPAYRPFELGYVLDQSGSLGPVRAPAFNPSEYRARVDGAQADRSAAEGAC